MDDAKTSIETIRATVFLPARTPRQLLSCQAAIRALGALFPNGTICWSAPPTEELVLPKGIPMWHGWWKGPWRDSRRQIDSHMALSRHIDGCWSEVCPLLGRIECIAFREYARAGLGDAYQSEIFVEAWPARRVLVDYQLALPWGYSDFNATEN